MISMSLLFQDVTGAVRRLAQARLFTVTAVASLAIGISSSTTTYQAIRDFYFTEPPAVGEPSGLVRVRPGVSYRELQDLRQQPDALDEAAAYLSPIPFLVNIDGETQRVYGQLVTTNYFVVLRVPVAFGAFSGDADRPDLAPAVVVSDRFWRTRLHGRRDAIGGALIVNGQAMRLAAVTPPQFVGASPLLEPADLWVSVTTRISVAPELRGGLLENPADRRFGVVGRLHRGVDLTAAEARLDGASRLFALEHHLDDRNVGGRRLTLVPGGRVMPLSDRERAFATVFPAVLIGLVLWVACSNVANLLVARGAARRREVALKLALGATRATVVRQLVTESAVLAVTGGVLGLPLVWWSQSPQP